jgi:hypothetical protein
MKTTTKFTIGMNKRKNIKAERPAIGNRNQKFMIGMKATIPGYPACE